MSKASLILVVDDDLVNLKKAQTILLKAGYRVAATVSGNQALQFFNQATPDLILLDIRMQGMDGFETLKRIRYIEAGKNVPVIFLTGETESEVEAKCFKAGALDFVSKPVTAEVLLSRVERILTIERYQKDLEAMVEEKVQEIVRIQNSVVHGIANVIEMRDGNTGEHVKNAVGYVTILIEELKNRGLYHDILTDEYIQNTIKGAVLHDVGKIRVSDAILCKPGKLTPEEFEQMKLHTVYGREIMNDIFGDVASPEYLAISKEIAGCHHERWDGTGYPDGLKGQDIPLCARIMTIADVFDALYSERCYKPPIRPVSKVLEIIKEGSDTQFDPVLVDVFVSLEDKISEFVGEK